MRPTLIKHPDDKCIAVYDLEQALWQNAQGWATQSSQICFKCKGIKGTKNTKKWLKDPFFGLIFVLILKYNFWYVDIGAFISHLNSDCMIEIGWHVVYTNLK